MSDNNPVIDGNGLVLNRRRFMAYFSSIGLSATLMPGALASGDRWFGGQTSHRYQMHEGSHCADRIPQPAPRSVPWNVQIPAQCPALLRDQSVGKLLELI